MRLRELDSAADSDRYWRRPLSGILSTLGQLPEGFYDSSLKMQTVKEKQRERRRGRVVNEGTARQQASLLLRFNGS